MGRARLPRHRDRAHDQADQSAQQVSHEATPPCQAARPAPPARDDAAAGRRPGTRRRRPAGPCRPGCDLARLRPRSSRACGRSRRHLCPSRQRFALAKPLARWDSKEDQQRHLRWSEVVVRGGVEPPTFRFSGGRSYRLSYLTVPEYPACAVLTGFEPATSTLTGWRALLAALQDHVYRPPTRRAVPPTGFEPVPPP